MAEKYEVDPRSPNYHNVTEAWEIHDTIAVGKDISGENPKEPGWYGSYSQFAQNQEHSFFNVRNRGEVGLAYNNLETKDSMPYVFHIYSIGLRFIAHPVAIQDDWAESVRAASAIWAGHAQEHVGVRLRVREDEKLLNNGMLVPEGAGTVGNNLYISPGAPAVEISSVTPGIATLSNRFNFPMPIEVPRAATFSVTIQLAKYIQDVLKNIPGPGSWEFSLASEGPVVVVPARSLIRMTLIGKRAVQQRGELHY